MHILPKWFSGKESACQCRRCRFDPWIRKIPWKSKWQPTPVFLPGKSYGQRSLAGYSSWSCKDSDTTEQLSRTEHPHQSILLIGSKKSFETAHVLTNSHCSCCLAGAWSSLSLFSSSAWHQPLPGLPYSAVLLLISSSLTTGPCASWSFCLGLSSTG